MGALIKSKKSAMSIACHPGYWIHQRPSGIPSTDPTVPGANFEYPVPRAEEKLRVKNLKTGFFIGLGTIAFGDMLFF